MAILALVVWLVRLEQRTSRLEERRKEDREHHDSQAAKLEAAIRASGERTERSVDRLEARMMERIDIARSVTNIERRVSQFNHAFAFHRRADDVDRMSASGEGSEEGGSSNGGG